MLKALTFLILILLSSCSYFGWLDDLQVQGIKDKKEKTLLKSKRVRDSRDKFLGRYKFAGANIERSGGRFTRIQSCPRESLLIEKNEFDGLSLSFRERGQYFFESIFFIDKNPPENWVVEERLETTSVGNIVTQSRKSVFSEREIQYFVEYLTSIERVDDLLFYSSQVKARKINEVEVELISELHCAYSFDSIKNNEKKAQVKDMGY